MKQVLVQATLSVDGDILLPTDSRREWVTVEEAASALNVSGRTIRNQCQAGKLRHKRVGKLYRVHVSELRAEASDQKRESSTYNLKRASTKDGRKRSNTGIAKGSLVARSPEEAAFYHLTQTKKYNAASGQFEPKEKPRGGERPIIIEDRQTGQRKVWTRS